MKESRSTSKGMWWDGSYGGVYKDGTFLMLYIKPVLPTIDKYDEMSCWPNAPAGDDMCYTVYHGVKSPLSQAHIDYISGVIDKAIPDAGGGGGGGGSTGGEADVAHRVKVFGLAGEEDSNPQVFTFAADSMGKPFVIDLSCFSGQRSNVDINVAENYFTLPVMVNAYLTYNGVLRCSGVITPADASTHVTFQVDVFTRPSGGSWPSQPASTGTVVLKEGGNKNMQFYSKQWIVANMDSPQDVQMRVTPISAPAGFDMTTITFGKEGWGTEYKLSSCAVANPDLINF